MRKKWLWLLVLPVLLCGAIFWAQNARWNRVEAEFRQLLLREYASRKMFGIEVSMGNSRGEKTLGFLSRSEVKALAPSLHLMKSAPVTRSPDGVRLHFEGQLAEWSIALDSGREDDQSGNLSGDWSKRGLKLTPESCGALRQRVKTRWSREIAAIREEIRRGEQ